MRRQRDTSSVPATQLSPASCSAFDAGVLLLVGSVDRTGLLRLVALEDLLDVAGRRADRRPRPEAARSASAPPRRWASSSVERQRHGDRPRQPAREVHRLQDRAVVLSPLKPVSGDSAPTAIISRSDNSRSLTTIFGRLAASAVRAAPASAPATQVHQRAAVRCDGVGVVSCPIELLVSGGQHGRAAGRDRSVSVVNERTATRRRRCSRGGYARRDRPKGLCVHTLLPDEELVDLNIAFEDAHPREILSWALETSGPATDRDRLGVPVRGYGRDAPRDADPARHPHPVPRDRLPFRGDPRVQRTVRRAARTERGRSLRRLHRGRARAEEFGAAPVRARPRGVLRAEQGAPLFAALRGFDAWITSMRRDSARTRAARPSWRRRDRAGTARGEDQPHGELDAAATCGAT